MAKHEIKLPAHLRNQTTFTRTGAPNLISTKPTKRRKKLSVPKDSDGAYRVHGRKDGLALMKEGSFR